MQPEIQEIVKQIAGNAPVVAFFAFMLNRVYGDWKIDRDANAGIQTALRLEIASLKNEVETLHHEIRALRDILIQTSKRRKRRAIVG